MKPRHERFNHIQDVNRLVQVHNRCCNLADESAFKVYVDKEKTHIKFAGGQAIGYRIILSDVPFFKDEQLWSHDWRYENWHPNEVHTLVETTAWGVFAVTKAEAALALMVYEPHYRDRPVAAPRFYHEDSRNPWPSGQ